MVVSPDKRCVTLQSRRLLTPGCSLASFVSHIYRAVKNNDAKKPEMFYERSNFSNNSRSEYGVVRETRNALKDKFSTDG